MIGLDGRYILQLLALTLAFYVNKMAKVPREQPPGGESPCCCLIGQGSPREGANDRYIVQLLTPALACYVYETANEPPGKAPVAA